MRHLIHSFSRAKSPPLSNQDYGLESLLLKNFEEKYCLNHINGTFDMKFCDNPRTDLPASSQLHLQIGPEVTQVINKQTLLSSTASPTSYLAQKLVIALVFTLSALTGAYFAYGVNNSLSPQTYTTQEKSLLHGTQPEQKKEPLTLYPPEKASLWNKEPPPPVLSSEIPRFSVEERQQLTNLIDLSLQAISLSTTDRNKNQTVSKPSPHQNKQKLPQLTTKTTPLAEITQEEIKAASTAPSLVSHPAIIEHKPTNLVHHDLAERTENLLSANANLKMKADLQPKLALVMESTKNMAEQKKETLSIDLLTKPSSIKQVSTLRLAQPKPEKKPTTKAPAKRPNISISPFKGTLAAQKILEQNPTRTLKLYSVNTGERATITYARNGQYDPKGLHQINQIMRDRRTGEYARMDPMTLDFLYVVYRLSGSQSSINFISAYRSPRTNAALARASANVAKNSSHTRSRAIDFSLDDVSVNRLRKLAISTKMGGVGYYPSSFVHIDSERFRTWQEK